jgi:pilus assembly protein CpaF
MLQAMNTGHDGSLTTLHANTPRDTISRIETMALMAGIELPVKVIREQIASAVELIIQQCRLRDGSRKITHVTEVAGMEGDRVVLQDIFRMEANELRPTGLRPIFLPKLEDAGFQIAPQVFMASPGAARAWR